MTKINYQDIGCELDTTEDLEYLSGFIKKYRQSTDQAMATLATFARFKLESRKLRLAGRINEARLQERNAETVYEREVLLENRW